MGYSTSTDILIGQSFFSGRRLQFCSQLKIRQIRDRKFKQSYYQDSHMPKTRATIFPGFTVAAATVSYAVLFASLRE